MKRFLCTFVVLLSGFSTTLAEAADYGFPALNTAGRYFGVGWSHHTYHSRVSGRFNVLDLRHPAIEYPSRSLSYPYSPHYMGYAASKAVTVPNAGTVPSVTDWADPSASTFHGNQFPSTAPQDPSSTTSSDTKANEVGEQDFELIELQPSPSDAATPRSGRNPLSKPNRYINH